MTLGVAGLGSWGRNLVRNFDELAGLAWLGIAALTARAKDVGNRQYRARAAFGTLEAHLGRS